MGHSLQRSYTTVITRAETMARHLDADRLSIEKYHLRPLQAKAAKSGGPVASNWGGDLTVAIVGQSLYIL